MRGIAMPLSLCCDARDVPGLHGAKDYYPVITALERIHVGPIWSCCASSGLFIPPVLKEHGDAAPAYGPVFTCSRARGMDAHLDGWLDGEVGPLCYRARGTHSHPHSNATEHAAKRRVTEPPHVALECSRSKNHNRASNRHSKSHHVVLVVLGVGV